VRIASLLASATEIVCELGLGDTLVAISHECDHPPDVLDRPRVSRPRFAPDGLSSAEIDRAVRDTMAHHGSVYELDEEKLRAAAPDLILTQAVCEVCAVPTSLAQEAARLLDGRPAIVSVDSHSIDEIFASIRSVAAAAGVPERGSELEARLRSRIDAVQKAVAGARSERVLAVEWLDPPFVPGHWTPEMIRIAGGECLLAEPGAPSRQHHWEALSTADPDVLLVMPCGYGLAAARADADRFSDLLTGAARRAVVGGRAYVVDGSAYFNRSGPRMVDGIEILASLLHPERLVGYDVAWRPPGT
jgi:iron complex transport system substrate-binding protein